jgi:hypothetical protein
MKLNGLIIKKTYCLICMCQLKVLTIPIITITTTVNRWLLFNNEINTENAKYAWCAVKHQKSYWSTVSPFDTCNCKFVFLPNKQLGNLSAHAQQFARFKERDLGRVNIVIWFLSVLFACLVSFFLLTKKLLIYCIVRKARKVWERSEA